MQQVRRNITPWYLSTIPLNMAIGATPVISTLLILSLGGTVTEVGLMISSGAVATIIFSTIWGELSDRSALRKRYLLIIIIFLAPTLFLFSIASSLPQVVLYYTLLSIFSSGVAPIAVMYTVETCIGKDWQKEIAMYNSISSLGTILGFAMNSLLALFLQLKWLFCISAALCLISAAMLWKIGRESYITLERHAFPIRSLRDAERLISPIFHRLDLRHLRIPRSLKQFKPLQLLFLACFIQWTGICFYAVGQTPLMKDLGLSDSAILAINTSVYAVLALSFAKIAPSLKQERKKLMNKAIYGRALLIIGWGIFSLFVTRSFPYVLIFIFPLILIATINLLYTILWLPIVTFTVSSAPEHSKGSSQGELLSVIALSNALGSALGGLVMGSMGYTIGFVTAAIISVLAVPIISRIEMN
jgi:MFS family permease